jgi:CheY-like chemotaxis protein
VTKRILIVDDEFEILFVLQRVFEDFAGWTALAVDSSQEGLQKAMTEAFDAIVLDISMPDLDGFQFVEALRANPQTQSLPVVLLTAKVTPSDRQRFAQIDVSGAIPKPFDPMVVWQQVAALLGWNEKV